MYVAYNWARSFFKLLFVYFCSICLFGKDHGKKTYKLSSVHNFISDQVYIYVTDQSINDKSMSPIQEQDRGQCV